jgi:hypothetical protein
MGSRVNLGKVEEDYAVKHNQKRMESEDEYRPLTPMDAPRLPFPMNVNAPQPESPYKPGDGASPDARGTHKRRATLPSIALSPAEANALTKYWDRGEGSGSPVSGPLPQPSNLGPGAEHEGGIPAPLIGLAITSNSIAQKRRSRSADALHEMALQHGLADLPLRRRSAEIKYWRSTNRGIPEELDEADAHRSFAATVQEVGAFSDDDSDDDDVVGEDGGDNAAPQVIVATAVSPDNDVLIHAADDEAPSRPASDLAAAHADRSPGAPRAPAASPELATMDRVDQRLSQIEFNMAQLAHSMQVLTVDRGLAAPAGPDQDRRPSFKLERPPASKGARSSLEQRPQSRRATPSLQQRDAAAVATTAASAADSPTSGGGGGTAGSPSPAVLVARSVSLKAAPSSRLPRAHHPRQSPSCTDLPVQPAAAAPGALSAGDRQRSSAASHSAASGSPPPSRQQQQWHQHAAHHGQGQQQPRASPAPVLNFSNPFAPAQMPPPHHQQREQQRERDEQQREREEQAKQELQHSPTRLVEHVAPLYAALAHERGARKRLEAQVGALRADVAALAAAVGALQRQHRQGEPERGAAGPRKGRAGAAAPGGGGGGPAYGAGGAVGAWGAAPPPRGGGADDGDEADADEGGEDEEEEEEVLEVQELRDWKASHRPATPVAGGWIRGGPETEGGWRESRGEESWREEIF